MCTGDYESDMKDVKQCADMKKLSELLMCIVHKIGLCF